MDPSELEDCKDSEDNEDNEDNENSDNSDNSENNEDSENSKDFGYEALAHLTALRLGARLRIACLSTLDHPTSLNCRVTNQASDKTGSHLNHSALAFVFHGHQACFG